MSDRIAMKCESVGFAAMPSHRCTCQADKFDCDTKSIHCHGGEPWDKVTLRIGWFGRIRRWWYGRRR